MKSIVAMTVLLASVAATAAPTRVMVDGGEWDVDIIRGSYADRAATLAEQPWFGHKTMARQFLIAYQGYSTDTAVAGTSYPNQGGNRSPYFAYYDVDFKGRLNYYEIAPAVYQSENNYECIMDGLGRPNNGIDPASCKLWGEDVIDPWYCDESDQMYCYWAVATPAADFNISPGTGRYPIDGKMDLSFNNISGRIINTLVIYDGVDITNFINGCARKVDDTTISCKGISWTSVGIGQHTIEVFIDVDTGEQFSDSVTWTVN